MTKQEFDAIVDDAVKNGGATRAVAEQYVVSGFKLDEKTAKAFCSKVEDQKSKVKDQKEKK